MTLPTLYALSSNGKAKEWEIYIKHNEDKTYTIVRKYGYIDGKKQISENNITSGKNIGKKNETSIEEQANNESKSLWLKQKQKGYSESIETEQQIPLPMLAHDYNKRGKDIKMPCFVQPKLDGVRMIATKTNSVIKLFSRTGKVIHHMEHISKDLNETLTDNENIYIDGELFTFDLKFEEISGLCRTSKKLDKNRFKIKFHVFDIFDLSKPDENNDSRLKKLCELQSTSNITIVKTSFIKNSGQIQKMHDAFVQDGYEGLILRNINGKYSPNYRSKDLQKLKTFQDKEYEICGGHEGQGDDVGTVIFQCKDINDNKFHVRPRGTREIRKEYWANLDTYIGKKLSVRYQNLTEYGVPRFGVGIAVRDYE
mgnify:CR=1 FL=1